MTDSTHFETAPHVLFVVSSYNYKIVYQRIKVHNKLILKPTVS